MPAEKAPNITRVAGNLRRSRGVRAGEWMRMIFSISGFQWLKSDDFASS